MGNQNPTRYLGHSSNTDLYWHAVGFWFVLYFFLIVVDTNLLFWPLLIAMLNVTVLTMAACHDSKIFLSPQWWRPDQSPLLGHAVKVIFSPLWTALHLSTLDFLCHFITQSFCSIRRLCSSSESAFIFITPHEQTLQTHYLLPFPDRFECSLQDNILTRCLVLGAAGTRE